MAEDDLGHMPSLHHIYQEHLWNLVFLGILQPILYGLDNEG